MYVSVYTPIDNFIHEKKNTLLWRLFQWFHSVTLTKTISKAFTQSTVFLVFFFF